MTQDSDARKVQAPGSARLSVPEALELPRQVEWGHAGLADRASGGDPRQHPQNPGHIFFFAVRGQKVNTFWFLMHLLRFNAFVALKAATALSERAR